MRPAEEILSELERGVEQIETIKAEQATRVEAKEEYLAQEGRAARPPQGRDRRRAEEATEELAEERRGGWRGDRGGRRGRARPKRRPRKSAEEDEGGCRGGSREVVVASRHAVTAASSLSAARPPRPPSGQPQRPRVPCDRCRQATRTSAVAARLRPAGPRQGAEARRAAARPPVQVTRPASRRRSSSPRAQFQFPDERRLISGDWEVNARKIGELIPRPCRDPYGSDGAARQRWPLRPARADLLDAELRSAARPVRDALPSFQATAEASTSRRRRIIGDITSAITVIDEAEDALGGTFATKSCQDLTAPPTRRRQSRSSATAASTET